MRHYSNSPLLLVSELGIYQLDTAVTTVVVFQAMSLSIWTLCNTVQSCDNALQRVRGIRALRGWTGTLLILLPPDKCTHVLSKLRHWSDA